MKAPPRLTDPKSDASGFLRLLVHAGQTELPDAERMRALSARVGSLAGGGPAGAAGNGVGALGGGAAKGAGGAAALKVTAAVTLAAAVGGAAVLGLRQAPPPLREAPVEGAPAPLADPPALLPVVGRATLAAPPSPGSASERVSPVSPPVVVVVSTPKPAPLPTAGAGTAAPAPSAVAGHEGSNEVSAESEIALLQAARTALRDNPTAALALADRHAARFATGALAQEREVIAVEALLALNRREEAMERGQRFARDFPNSAHWTRIEALLRGSDHNP